MWSTRLFRPRRASRAGASLTRHGERGGPHSPAAFHAVSVRAIPQIMKNSILVRSATAAAALALALTACGGQQEQSPSAGSDEGGAVEASEPAEDATDSEGQETDTDDGEFGSDDESTTDDEASGDSEDDADEADEADEGESAGTLQIALEGEDTEFTPEIVRCNGEPGTIRNVVITMREDLPVVKVTPGEFAMVKLHDRGEPEKSSSTEDITAEDGTISFDQASIGDAVVDGTVECLQGNN